ncbi:MAG: carbohydrate ABC transporter substrate-binding protein [Deinococcus sp.]|nr:carbohydrate ABC transporter substrate-binding protein [Deinococcus sp.]
MKRSLKTLSLLLLGALLLFAMGPASGQGVRLVSLFVTFGGSELNALRQGLDAFTSATGIEVIVEQSREIIPILRTRVAGGNPPDVALVPRPGVVAEYARLGAIFPLVNADGSDGIMSAETLHANYSQGLIDVGVVDGVVYGLMAKANSKSTVWYKPASLAALGFSVPSTWDELIAITNAYRAAGKTPWSIGGQDGWTLTDWFENIYVRVAGPENYLRLFVTHEIEWTDPSVVEAMNLFRQIIRPEENLAGGAEGSLSRGFIDAANLVFRPDAGAELYYEGGFIGGIVSANFPDLRPGEDFTAFLFPAIRPEYGRPVVGGGDLLVAYRDTPEVREFFNFVAGTEFATIWAATGAIVSPNRNVDPSVYTVLAALDAGQVANAEAFVFDGSDLAPSALGGDAMFTGLQDFVSNPDQLTEILQFLEDVADANY